MKRTLAALLAFTMVFSYAAVPADSVIFESRSITASADTGIVTTTTLTSNKTYNGTVTISADYNLASYTLTVNGDLYITAGNFLMGTGKLVVTGNLYVQTSTAGQSSAYMRMDSDSSSITVGGNIVWNVVSTATPTDFTAGTIYVGGNIINNTSNANAFYTLNTCKLIFNGTGTQEIQTSGTEMGLASVQVTNSRSLKITGTVSLNQIDNNLNIISNGAIFREFKTSGTRTINISGDCAFIESNNIDLSNVTLNVTGTLNVKSGTFTVGSGKVTVSGNLVVGTINSNGSYGNVSAGFNMSNASGSVSVGGDFVLYTSASAKGGTLTAGTLTVAGSVLVGTNSKLSSSASHTTVMTTSGMTVSMPTTRKLGTLKLSYPASQYTFSPNTAPYTKLDAPAETSTAVALTSSMITISGSYTYTGSAITPTVTVKNGSTTLTSGTDYTMSVTNNTNAGTATVTITAKSSSYSGSATKTFTIAKANLSSATVNLNATSFKYTGSQIKPTVSSVTFNGSTVASSNYTVSYGTNVNVGTNAGSVTVTANSSSTNFTGSKTVNFNITSSTTALADSGVTLQYSSTAYTGAALTPTVTVKSGSTTLTNGTDYTVSYSNNTNAGTATVTVMGKGNYTGTVTKNFTITKANLSGATVTLNATSFNYTGSQIKPTVSSVTFNGKTVAASNYTVTYGTNTSAGTNAGSVTITANSSSTNFTGSKTVNFTINKVNLSGATVTLNATSFNYTGSQIKPTVTSVTVNGTTVAASNYTVSYGANVNAGTNAGSVTVTANSSSAGFTGSKTVNFTINKVNLSGATVTLNATSFNYTGSQIKPTVTSVTVNGTTVAASNYTVSYGANVNAGTNAGSVTVTANSSSAGFTGSKTVNFTINKVNLSGATVNLSTSSYVYTGSQIKPTVSSVTVNGTTVAASNYTVTYGTNINAGTNAGSVTVTATSSSAGFTGSKTINFTISPKTITDDMVTLSQSTFVYDGTAKTPAVTVKNGSTTLSSTNDYTVSYSNNTNVTDKAVAKVAAKGSNYTGTVTKYFTITKSVTDISKLTVDIQKEVEYTGSPVKPAITIKNGSTVLVEGVDYDVSISGNNTSVGTATVTVTCKGSYSGSKSDTFTIKKADLKNSQLTLSGTSFTANGSEQKPSVTVTLGGNTIPASEYDVSYSNNINAGTATVTVTAKSTSAGYTGSNKTTFTITAAQTDPVDDVVKGDINGDGKVDSKDALLSVSYTKKTSEPKNDRQFKAADVNDDGKLDSKDTMKIIAAAKKIIKL